MVRCRWWLMSLSFNGRSWFFITCESTPESGLDCNTSIWAVRVFRSSFAARIWENVVESCWSRKLFSSTSFLYISNFWMFSSCKWPYLDRTASGTMKILLTRKISNLSRFLSRAAVIFDDHWSIPFVTTLCAPFLIFNVLLSFSSIASAASNV